MLPSHQYIFGLLFILAGINHFRKPRIYERIMPPYFPKPKLMVVLSGIAEMVLGFMLLNKETQSIAAWTIIAMLGIFLTVHIFMLQNERASFKLPKWILILRIPLQFVLMYWAYLYT